MLIERKTALMLFNKTTPSTTAPKIGPNMVDVVSATVELDGCFDIRLAMIV